MSFIAKCTHKKNSSTEKFDDVWNQCCKTNFQVDLLLNDVVMSLHDDIIA